MGVLFVNGTPEWSQIIFLAGVIMTSVVIGAGFALWIMGQLREIAASASKRSDDLEKIISSQALAMEKVIGALRLAFLEELKQTRHAIYGRVDTVASSFKEEIEPLQERTRQIELDIAKLAPLRNGRH